MNRTRGSGGKCEKWRSSSLSNQRGSEACVRQIDCCSCRCLVVVDRWLVPVKGYRGCTQELTAMSK